MQEVNQAAVLIVDVSRRLCSKCETPVVNAALLSSLSTNSSDPFINETRRLRMSDISVFADWLVDSTAPSLSS